ncbi:hypothetical protein OHA72_45225 [Dactylosporangium sp. NBC_01737]|nr:hypothetical protein OHA72_45225 [Dactylosporangium sp. NBC_01737]
MTLSGRLGSMHDIVDGCLFLLENPMANGIEKAEPRDQQVRAVDVGRA